MTILEVHPEDGTLAKLDAGDIKTLRKYLEKAIGSVWKDTTPTELAKLALWVGRENFGRWEAWYPPKVAELMVEALMPTERKVELLQAHSEEVPYE